MNRLKQILVWISRWRHCRGFGIQSPADYRFERTVINETYPYYAYERIGMGDSKIRQKLGQLYFRLTNYRQPEEIIDMIRAKDYALAACSKARIVDNTDHVELAFVPIECEYQQLLNMCDDRSVVVFEGIHRNMPLWHCIEYDQRTIVTYDLYYCGIVLFDHKRSKQNYIVNF